MPLMKDVASRMGTQSGGPPLKEIPLGDIRIKDNVRSEYIGIDELAETIRQYGLQHPITVYRDGEEYAVKTGHRRFKAYELLNTKEPDRFHSIRCIVSDEKDVAIIQLIENVQREDLSPPDLFKALHTLREQGVSVQKMAAIMGKEEKTVKNLLVGVNEIATHTWLEDFIASPAGGTTLQDIVETQGIAEVQRRDLLEQRRQGRLSRKELREKVKAQKEDAAAILPNNGSSDSPQKVEVRVTVDTDSKTITLCPVGNVAEVFFANFAEDIKNYLAKSKMYKIGTDCPAGAGQ